MRTTLTIEPAIAEEIRKRMKTRKATMKQVINDLLLAGLRNSNGTKPVYKFKVRPHALGLLPGIDRDKIGQYVDQLEDEERIAKMRRG